MTKADSTPVPDFLARARLTDTGAVVLGAGQGIGRQVAHALAQAGAHVLCVDADASLAQEVAAEVGGSACSADITTRPGMEQVFEASRRLPARLATIVDIVGRAYIGAIEDLDDEAYWAQHEVVYRHAWLTLQLGAPRLAEGGGGSIVFIGSTSGVTSAQGQALYGSQKAALHHLVRCAAVEFGPRGVRVNTVAPGFTRTPRLNELMRDRWDEVTASVPLRRAGEPEDVASVVLFLASAMARHVTAQTVIVDGGLTATTSRPGVPARKQQAAAN